MQKLTYHPCTRSRSRNVSPLNSFSAHGASLQVASVDVIVKGKEVTTAVFLAFQVAVIGARNVKVS